MLRRLGYTWAMRMDDDSVVHSPINYNIFESMRATGHLYGWRQLAKLNPRICGELKLLQKASPELGSVPAWNDFCRLHTNTGVKR